MHFCWAALFIFVTFSPQFFKSKKKCSKDASIIFERVDTRTMIFDEEEDHPSLHSKSQTSYAGRVHGRVIWSKHMNTRNETIFGMKVFLRAVGLGKEEKIFQNNFSVKDYRDLFNLIL